MLPCCGAHRPSGISDRSNPHCSVTWYRWNEEAKRLSASLARVLGVRAGISPALNPDDPDGGRARVAPLEGSRLDQRKVGEIAKIRALERVDVDRHRAERRPPVHRAARIARSSVSTALAARDAGALRRFSRIVSVRRRSRSLTRSARAAYSATASRTTWLCGVPSRSAVRRISATVASSSVKVTFTDVGVRR